MKKEDSLILIENTRLRLSLREDGIAESLVDLATGEELLDQSNLLPFCSLDEERPFNNEIKLAYPNKHMTFSANRVRLDGNRLYVGFELVLFEAILEVCEHPDYITFRLADFNVPAEAFNDFLTMDTPPVESFRLLQLPIRKREKFGEWLNVVSDDRIAVGILASSPYEDIDSYRYKDSIVLFANALNRFKLRDSTAVLIGSKQQDFLDCIAQMEEEFGLPHGVESRRGDRINRSAFWTATIDPSTVDECISLAKQAGLTHMLIYYTALFKNNNTYASCGNYEECDLKDTYPNGFASVKEMLDKIRAAGIVPGIHFLHTHIGTESRYVTPVADHRLRLKQHFTLSKPLSSEDTTVYVEENPQSAPMHEQCRILRFGGELITYTGYSKEPPYRFTGCTRGAFATNVCTHEAGKIGGIMDITEYGATSFYLDQESSLQDEIADKLANVYNLGFRFIYFDGSEGTSAPFNINVSLAQYRILKKLGTPPIYCEGAAKTHFGWHWMSGGNAFDVFPAPVFKKNIVKYPFEEAFRMAQDFTRLNFGWWVFNHDMMPDMYEYGNALAVSHDCPVTVMLNDLSFIKAHPRITDILETFRRWERARIEGFLTKEQKLSIQKDTDVEHTLLINEQGNYELCACTRIEGAANGDSRLCAYLLERQGKTYVSLFHTSGSGTLSISLPATHLLYEKELGGERLPVTACDAGALIKVDDRHYLSTEEGRDTVIKAIQNAIFTD